MARRLVIDGNVIDQVLRGNRQAAEALRRLSQEDGTTLLIPEWQYREIVEKNFPRQAAAVDMILAELKIVKVARPQLSTRVDTHLRNTIRGTTPASDQSTVSAGDQQLISTALAEKAELWSFDRTFRLNANDVAKRNPGLRIAPETKSIMLAKHSGKADYRVARQLLRLEEVEISFNGRVTRRPGGNAIGSPASAAPIGAPVTRQPTAGPSKVRIRLKPTARISVGPSLRMGRIKGAGRIVGGAVLAVAVGVLFSYIQSRVDQSLIQEDFERHSGTINDNIVQQADVVSDMYARNPDARIYAIVQFTLEYINLWEPSDRVETRTYLGMTIDAVRIASNPVESIGDYPFRTPGKWSEIIRVAGSISLEVDPEDLFDPADLAQARIAEIESMSNRASMPPQEVARLNAERDRLVKR